MLCLPVKIKMVLSNDPEKEILNYLFEVWDTMMFSNELFINNYDKKFPKLNLSPYK